MTCKATEQVATTGIDIDKNSLHLLGLEGCFGSPTDHQAARLARPESGASRRNPSES